MKLPIVGLCVVVILGLVLFLYHRTTTTPTAQDSKVPMSLELDRHEVTAGPDSYTLKIKGLRDSDVDVKYTLNDDPAKTFTTHVDREGQVVFHVEASTPKGVYRMLSFRPVGGDWTDAAESITVK